MRYATRLAVAGAALLMLAPAADGQTIAERVGEVREGKVRMSFAARPGVCGDGRHTISFGPRHWTFGGSEDWEPVCEPGPVRVLLHVGDGEVREMETFVAGRWRSPDDRTLDLGIVSAPHAARYLLSLARSGHGGVAKEALLPAMLADSVTVWPELLALAKDGSVASGTRKSAVFWLGQAAEEVATEKLDEIAMDKSGDREVREMAIFALSQRPRDEGVPVLIRIVRTNRDAGLVRKALFWLGQSEDPRALALFEEILTGK